MADQLNCSYFVSKQSHLIALKIQLKTDPKKIFMGIQLDKIWFGTRFITIIQEDIDISPFVLKRSFVHGWIVIILKNEKKNKETTYSHWTVHTSDCPKLKTPIYFFKPALTQTICWQNMAKIAFLIIMPTIEVTSCVSFTSHVIAFTISQWAIQSINKQNVQVKIFSLYNHLKIGKQLEL